MVKWKIYRGLKEPWRFLRTPIGEKGETTFQKHFSVLINYTSKLPMGHPNLSKEATSLEYVPEKLSLSLKRHSLISTILFLFVSLSRPGIVDAQVVVPDNFYNSYLNIVTLKNGNEKEVSFNRSIFYGQDSLEWDIWSDFHFFDQNTSAKSFQWVNPLLKIDYNSAYPRSYNDGPIWKGKGLTSSVNFGFQGHTGHFYYTVVPNIFHSQNLDFQLLDLQPTFNKFNYQLSTYGLIDWVQRYGDNGFVNLNAGQSEVRYINKKVTIGLGTQNISFGPSLFNPIVMSKNAGGFPHVDVGTYSPVNIKIRGTDLGKIYTRFYAGILQRSMYYNSNFSESQHRYFTGFEFSYMPPFIDGLKIGLNKTLYENSKYFKLSDIVASVYRINRITTRLDYFDQLASATFDYTLREADARVYFELAKNDFNGDLRDFFVDFGHGTGYTLGLQKAFDLASGNNILAGYEHTRLSRTKGYLYRPSPPFYTHFINEDGYTNNGQIIGAGIGPGGVSDKLYLDFFHDNGGLELSLQRITFDNDFFITNYGFQVVPDVDFSNKNLIDNEYTLEAKYFKISNRFSFEIDLSMSYRLNWYYLYKNDKVNIGSSFAINYFIRK